MPAADDADEGKDISSNDTMKDTEQKPVRIPSVWNINQPNLHRDIETQPHSKATVHTLQPDTTDTPFPPSELRLEGKPLCRKQKQAVTLPPQIVNQEADSSVPPELAPPQQQLQTPTAQSQPALQQGDIAQPLEPWQKQFLIAQESRQQQSTRQASLMQASPTTQSSAHTVPSVPVPQGWPPSSQSCLPMQIVLPMPESQSRSMQQQFLLDQHGEGVPPGNIYSLLHMQSQQIMRLQMYLQQQQLQIRNLAQQALQGHFQSHLGDPMLSETAGESLPYKCLTGYPADQGKAEKFIPVFDEIDWLSVRADRGCPPMTVYSEADSLEVQIPLFCLRWRRSLNGRLLHLVFHSDYEMLKVNLLPGSALCKY